MTATLPLALSLSSSFTEVGAIAAFAALLGIAILSLLVFSQAREIKRLREWAGRAPERAAEVEQRVSANAAARARGVGDASAGQPVPARVPPGARVTPRKTPLVSAPVSTAVNATVAAVVPVAGGSSAQSSQLPPSGQERGPVPADVPAGSAQAQQAVAAETAVDPSGGAVGTGQVRQSPSTGAPPTTPAAAPSSEAPSRPAMMPDGTPVAVTGSVPAAAPGSAIPAQPTTVPATAAARTAGVSARAPLPPSPASPAPPGASSSVPSASSEPPAQAPDHDARPSAAVAASRPPAPAASPRPPAAVAAARSGNRSRVVADSEPVASPRASSPSRSLSAGVAATAGARAASARSPGGAGGPKYYKPERSPRRRMALIVGGAIVGVVAIVVAVSALKGGGGAARPATQASSPVETQPASSSHKASHPAVTNPAEIAVAVLNGTSTAGLAHHLAADLQQSGYTHAVALGGVPPGTHATTVVEYSHAHRADAQAVAKALNVTQLQATEPAISSLAGTATVVVLAGVDQATQLGGGGAGSNGEPAAGTPGGH
jgi:LytR cell envelope-related transcriptional attenuator